jgi:hypothetical protein
MFYNWALEDHNVHILEHLMFMVSAVIVWWPVVDPVPELTRIQTPVRLLYLFALSVPDVDRVGTHHAVRKCALHLVRTPRLASSR